MTQKETRWDDESNEAQSNFVSWGSIGDFILGTLIGVREVKSTLPGKEGEIQKVYDMEVKECAYHQLDDKKNPIEPAETPEENSVISVGGRKTIDSRMLRAKLGQIVGLKYVEELPAKTKGFNPTKVIKVFFPKEATGELKMNQAWLDTNNF